MTDLEQLESSLNIVTYLRKYDEYYRGVQFSILQITDQTWVVQMTTELLMQKLDSYKEAFAYSMGYIDGCIADTIESGDYD